MAGAFNPYDPEKWGPRETWADKAPPTTSRNTQFYKRADSCVGRFQDLVAVINSEALQNATLSDNQKYDEAMFRIQRCFDDRVHWQRYSNYCGEWRDENHFLDTRMLLQLYYTLGRLRAVTIDRPAGAAGAAPWPPLANTLKIMYDGHYHEFKIKRLVGGKYRDIYYINNQGFKVPGAGAPPTNAIDIYQEYQPFGHLYLSAFTPCDGHAPHEWPVDRIFRNFNLGTAAAPLYFPLYEPALPRGPIIPSGATLTDMNNHRAAIGLEPFDAQLATLETDARNTAVAAVAAAATAPAARAAATAADARAVQAYNNVQAATAAEQAARNAADRAFGESRRLEGIARRTRAGTDQQKAITAAQYADQARRAVNRARGDLAVANQNYQTAVNEATRLAGIANQLEGAPAAAAAAQTALDKYKAEVAAAAYAASPAAKAAFNAEFPPLGKGGKRRKTRRAKKVRKNKTRSRK